MIVEIGFWIMIVFVCLVITASFRIEFCGKNKKTFRSKKKTVLYYLNNVMFHIYVLYGVSVLLTIFRVIAFATFCTSHDCHSYFTIAYNWAGGYIVTVSTLVPLRLMQIKKNPMASVTTNNFRSIVIITVVYVILLAAVLTALFGFSIEADVVKLAARVWFMIQAFIEIGLVLSCLSIFKESSSAKTYMHFVKATVVMRGGIVVIILLKYVDFVPTDWLKFFHMSVMIIGLTYNNQKLLKDVKQQVKTMSNFAKSQVHNDRSVKSEKSITSTVDKGSVFDVTGSSSSKAVKEI